ncbi:MAG: hypothetical protein M3345_01630 [Actinomycetota bacterium]|nr:hypothetical protein [Actinomycetota bacterium]
MRRSLAALISVLLVGCGGDQVPPEAVRQEAAPTMGASPAEESTAGRSGAKKNATRAERDRKRDRHKGANGISASSASKTGSGEQSHEDQDRDGQTETGESGAARGYPSAGTYLYAQSGYEEFCGAASCDRADLPARQRVEVSDPRRSDGGVIVVVHAAVSDRSSTRTTYRFERDRAVILEMAFTTSSGSFEYTTSYEPKPPIRALVLPLAERGLWSGTWEGRVSGSYRVRIQGRAPVRVGTRTVDAVKLATSATFEGELEGTTSTTLWIDPATYQVLRSEGDTDARSSLGRYRTEFTTALRTGPGY